MADVGRIPIPLDDVRINVVLIGAINGSNQAFSVPESFLHNPPKTSIQVFLNGQALLLSDDYTLSESGGIGTGFDTVTTVVVPRSGDKIWAHYIVSS